jgi:hypothetical protein
MPAVSQTSNAFSDKLPDDSNFGNNNGNVLLVDQETRYVRNTDTRLGVWSLSPNMNIKIINPNYCSSNAQDGIETEDHTYSNIGQRQNVTKFTFGASQPGEVTYFGKKYASGNSECQSEMNVNFTATEKQPGTNYYIVKLNIDHVNIFSGNCNNNGINGCDGTVNGYKINVSNNAKIGVRGNDTGRGITMVQNNTSPQTLNYYATFGTPCTTKTDTTAKITLYDMDNAGGSGAQPDWVGNVRVNINDLTTGNDVWPKDWIPKGDNVTVEKDFTAQPNHKYKLRLENVYYNNTIQYSVPFDQIYVEQCPSTATLKAKATVSANIIQKGQSVNFSNWVEVDDVFSPGSATYTAKINGENPTSNWTTRKIADGNYYFSGKRNFTFKTNDSTSPGYHCRTTDLGGKPNWAEYSPKSASACVFVYDPNGAGASPGVQVTDYEKGTGAKKAIHEIKFNPCLPSGFNVNIGWVASAVADSPENSYTTSGSTNLSGCGGAVYEANLNVDNLNTKNPGYKIKFKTNVTSPVAKNGTEMTTTVYEVPFVRFYGNDIYAKNGVVLFNDTSNNDAYYDGRGSVAQYAAFATGATNYLDTAAFRSLAIPVPHAPNGLDSYMSYLANIRSNYDKIELPEFCDKSNITPTIFHYDDKCFDQTGDKQLAGGNYTKKVTLKTDGNLTITGNIVNDTISYNNPSSVGVVLIMARGNIYIDKSVTRLDAILISKGKIYTCTSAGVPVLNTQVNSQCRSKLVVNGALEAQEIQFQRVGGSRYLGPGEGNSGNQAGIANLGGVPSGTITSNEDGTASETINFPSYLYWAQPFLQSRSESGGKVEAIFLAPPRL